MYNRINPLLTRSFSNVTKTTKPRRKVIKVGDNRPIIMKHREINANHEKKALEMGLEFRIMSSSVLHRYPIITKYPWEIDKQEVDDAVANKQREYFKTLVKGTDAEKLVPEEQMVSLSIC